jgi:hypothetical protein
MVMLFTELPKCIKSRAIHWIKNGVLTNFCFIQHLFIGFESNNIWTQILFMLWALFTSCLVSEMYMDEMCGAYFLI